MAQDPDAEKDVAAELRLRAEPPPVTRLSRRALAVLSGTAALAIGSAVAVAMRENPGTGQQTELVATDAKPAPDALAGLPKDYAALPKDTPRLGPPLPGDLARPILSAQSAGAGGSTNPGSPTDTASPPDAVRQQKDQERQAARTSQLFAPGAGRGERGGEAPAGHGPPLPVADPSVEARPADHTQAFLSAAAEVRTWSGHRLQAPISPDVLQAGSVIPAALVTGIRSDLPGQVTAQVTENVFDSATGRRLLVPQGSRLVGLYDSEVEFGQTRLLLAWTRLILPGGRSIVLDRQPAGDAQGFAGLEDRVDRHWRQLASAAAISTLLSAGAELGSDQGDSDLMRALRRGGANAVGDVGQQVVGRSLGVQPTITIRPGFPVRVILTRDVVLEAAGT